MKGGLLITLTILTTLAAYYFNQPTTYSQFQNWKQTYQISFETEAQEFYRRTIFYHNYAKIIQHNLRTDQTYKMGVNQLSIYSDEEFSSKFLNQAPKILKSKVEAIDNRVSAVIIDWVAKGAVTSVKNQGSCGSGVVYSTLGGVQGLSKVSTGSLQNFSAQQLIDCLFGCAGSFAADGYKYYKSHGVCTESEYPYVGRPQACKNKTCAFKIQGQKQATTCSQLEELIMIQPVSVAVDATNWSPYASGIFNNCAKQLNHLALLVGMADEYWTVKNSWGTSWGQKGFIRLARGNTCGICSTGIAPTR